MKKLPIGLTALHWGLKACCFPINCPLSALQSQETALTGMLQQASMHTLKVWLLLQDPGGICG